MVFAADLLASNASYIDASPMRLSVIFMMLISSVLASIRRLILRHCRRYCGTVRLGFSLAFFRRLDGFAIDQQRQNSMIRP